VFYGKKKPIGTSGIKNLVYQAFSKVYQNFKNTAIKIVT
jgi:hypothetical protein